MCREDCRGETCVEEELTSAFQVLSMKRGGGDLHQNYMHAVSKSTGGLWK